MTAAVVFGVVFAVSIALGFAPVAAAVFAAFAIVPVVTAGTPIPVRSKA